MCGSCGCSEIKIKSGNKDFIAIEKAVLSENDRYAAQNRQRFAEKGLCVFNIVSSPGSGKTTLLESLIPDLKACLENNNRDIAVIEGDQQTALDAERIAKTGVKVKQINTGSACHLDAHQVAHAVEYLEPLKPGLLLIENIGNLICPALFDLGEAKHVALISVTEGADKPLKYPDMFRRANWVVITKVDLIDYVDFDLTACENHIRQANPKAVIFYTSAKSKAGLGDLQQVMLTEAGVDESMQ